MDNSIRVMLNNQNQPGSSEGLDTDHLPGTDVNVSGLSNKTAFEDKSGLSLRVEVVNNIPSQAASPPDDAQVCKDEKKIKDRTLLVYCDTKSKTFLADMKNVVFQKFGTVRSAEWRQVGPDKFLAVVMYSSELDAVRCINETNSISYKGQSLRVKFDDGSIEDSAAFRRQYLNLFRNYPTELIPRKAETASKSQVENRPIGVLPPSKSLGGFGALPDVDVLTSIIENFRRATEAKAEATTTPPASTTTTANAAATTTANGHLSSSVEGSMYCVNSKIVLIQFFDGSCHRLAKMIPGQMFIDGKKSLGYAIKNDPFQQWPPFVKTFLQPGSKVRMELRVLSAEEIAEVGELTSEVVTHSAPLIWRSHLARPSDQELTITRVHPEAWILKGVVISVLPKWGVLQTSSGNVFFENSHLFINGSRNSASTSLLNFVEVGDVLATQCKNADYLEVSELARNAPGFSGSTKELTFLAKLVWNIPAEVDPHTVCAESGDEIRCKFVATSATLNCALPSERESHFTSLSGVIEELHLPAGGIITLDPETTINGRNLSDHERHVYFHRSRLYINGSKVSSNVDLAAVLVPGDRVTVDVVSNDRMAFVSCQTFWMALVVKAKTTDRGVTIANALRMEVDLVVDDDLDRIGISEKFQAPLMLFSFNCLLKILSPVCLVHEQLGSRSKINAIKTLPVCWLSLVIFSNCDTSFLGRRSDLEECLPRSDRFPSKGGFIRCSGHRGFRHHRLRRIFGAASRVCEIAVSSVRPPVGQRRSVACVCLQ